jgi:hypothetical protein
MSEYFRWGLIRIRINQIETRIAFLLKSQTLSRKVAINKLRQTMSEIGQKAVVKGLTPEILEDILKDDEG